MVGCRVEVGGWGEKKCPVEIESVAWLAFVCVLCVRARADWGEIDGRRICACAPTRAAGGGWAFDETRIRLG